MKGHTMKKLHIALLLILLFAIPSMAQKNGEGEEEQSIKRKDVPKAVLAAFEKSYSKATVKGYSRESEEGKTVYEIESKEGTINRDILYAADGTLISVEETLPYAQLPDAVRNTIAKEYSKAKVSKCEKLIKGSTTEFELHLKSGKKNIEVLLDAGGKVVKKESKKEKEVENEEEDEDEEEDEKD